MEIPNEISNKKVVWIVITLLIVLFFLYRAYANSRQALQILAHQVPHITRVAFETEVFTPRRDNLDAVLKKVTKFGPSAEMKQFKKELDSNLWIGLFIRNRGFKSASDIRARIRLATPITAIRGFNSTPYAKLEAKEGGIGKKSVLLDWTYLEPGNTAVIFLGVQPEDFDGKPPYSTKATRLWARDYKLYFDLAEVQAGEGTAEYVY